MRLSSDELYLGKQYLYRRDLPGLVRWARSLQIVTLDLDELERTFARQFKKPELADAERIFDNYFGRVDREEEYRQWRFGLLQWFIYSLAFGVGVLWMFVKASKG